MKAEPRSLRALAPKVLLLGLALALLPALASAQALPALTTTETAGGGTTYSLTLQTLLLMTLLSFIPAMVLMMTSFTRIIIVFSLLRQAMGTQTAPPNQVLLGLALFLTFFIMAPVAERVFTRTPICPCRRARSSSTRRSSAPRCR